MTTLIDEMVNGYNKEAMLFKVGEGEMERHQRLQNYVVEALTEAHQAGKKEGIDDAVEKATKIAFGTDLRGRRYVDIEDLKKALQDNK